MDKQTEKQLLHKQASLDAHTHVRSSSKSLAGQPTGVLGVGQAKDTGGIFHIAPLESKLMTVNDLPQVARQKKSNKTGKPFHFRTLSPRAVKAKTSFEKISKKSAQIRTEDVENVLKEKVAQHRNTSVHVPKISSAYQKTTYKFRAKEQPLPPERNRTPTEHEIRTAIRSQLPVFGYNCEKRNTATLSHWNTSSPPNKSQSKMPHNPLEQRTGSRPTQLSQRKESHKVIFTEQNESPRMRQPIALDVRGLTDTKEFKILSPRKGSVHSSMDTAAMRESLTDVDTFRGFMDPVLRTLNKGRKSPSSMHKSERQISRDNLALLHEARRDEDVAAYYSYVDSYASNNIINEMIMEGYSIEETEGSKPTTSQRRTAYSRYTQLRERIQASKEMQPVKVRTFQMKNNSKTNSESSFDQSAPFKSPRTNGPPLSSPQLPTRSVLKGGADPHHSLLKMLNEFRKRGGVAPKNISSGVQKLKTAILIQPYAEYFSEPAKPTTDEKVLAFKRNSKKVNIPDQNYSLFTDKQNTSVYATQPSGIATTNLAKVVQLNQQVLLTERSESLTLTSDLPGRRHMKELLLRTPGESETNKAITHQMLPRSVLRQGKKQGEVVSSSRRQSVLPMLFPIPVNAGVLSNQQSVMVGSSGMTPEPKERGRMTVPHELVSRYDMTETGTYRNNESVEGNSKQIGRIREAEGEGNTTQDQTSTVQQNEKQDEGKSKQASQAEIQTVEQAAGSVIESIPTIMEVTMTREMGSKTSLPSKLATQLTLQNVTPFSRGTFNQDANPTTPNRRYEGVQEVPGAGHALSTVTSIYQDSPGREYVPPATTSSMPPPRKTVAYTYQQKKAKKQITNSFFETQQHAELYLDQTMHSDDQHSAEERKRPLYSKRKKLMGVSNNTTPFEGLEVSHDNLSSDFITLVGSRKNKLRGVNTGGGKSYKQERLLRSGEWEQRSPEPQPFSNERIKHATTETSRGNLLQNSKNNRGEIMQLIQRRTFFKSSRKGALSERNREERRKKMIFGFSCKDDKEFRQKYFHKSLLVPESLNVLREEENKRKNSNKSERGVVLPRIRQKVI